MSKIAVYQRALDEIEQSLPEGGDWCSLDKAHTLACLVMTLRPELVVEIGVWRGGSLIPMLIAQRACGVGRAIAIDPWSPEISAAGEVAKNASWWGSVDHDAAFAAFAARLVKHEVGDRCQILRKPSDDVTPPEGIGLLHIDGKHTEQAIRDVRRFAPYVISGGILVLDDLHWEGGHVERAARDAADIGFRLRYEIGGTCGVFQRCGDGW